MNIPKGWKLVPVKPTPEMKTAGIAVEVYPESPPELACLTWAEAEAIYQAMLDAAPQPPVQRKPMTEEEIGRLYLSDKFKWFCDDFVYFKEIARATERHHGIGDEA